MLLPPFQPLISSAQRCLLIRLMFGGGSYMSSPRPLPPGPVPSRAEPAFLGWVEALPRGLGTARPPGPAGMGKQSWVCECQPLGCPSYYRVHPCPTLKASFILCHPQWSLPLTCLSVFYFLLIGCTHSRWDFSSPTRDQTHVLCIGRRSLRHWTTGMSPNVPFIDLAIVIQKRHRGYQPRAPSPTAHHQPSPSPSAAEGESSCASAALFPPPSKAGTQSCQKEAGLDSSSSTG